MELAYLYYILNDVLACELSSNTSIICIILNFMLSHYCPVILYKTFLKSVWGNSFKLTWFFYNQKTCQPKGASTPTMITRMRTVRSLVLGIRTYKTSSLAILTLLIGYNMTTKAAVHTWRTTRASELKTSGNPKCTVNYVIFHRARDFQTLTTDDKHFTNEYKYHACVSV